MFGFGRSVAKDFKKAAWETREAVLAFARDVEPSLEDMTAMLEVLLDSRINAEEHKLARQRLAFITLAKRVLDPELFIPYVEALPKLDEATRKVFTELLPKINNVKGHARLCEQLGSSNAQVRSAAAEILGAVGDKHAFEMLERIIAKPNFAGRIEALDVIVPKAGHHAFPLLATVLEHGEPHEQKHALEFLSESEYVRKDRNQALGVLALALASSDAGVRRFVLNAIRSLTEEDDFFERTQHMADSPRAEVVVSFIELLAESGTERAFNILRRKLREGPDSVRKAVLVALEKVGTEAVLPLLVDALASPKIVVRTVAADVISKLGKSGKVDVAKAIIWLLRSRDPNVRRMAAEIANEVAETVREMAPRLLSFLTDEDWWVRERVMDALAKMWLSGLTRHLVAFLKDPSDAVRRFAVGALRRVCDPDAIGALVRTALDDSDWLVRESAVSALAALKDKRAIPYLLKMLDGQPDLRLAVIDALVEIGSLESASNIAECVSDEDPDVRLATVGALKSLGSAKLAPQVRSLEADPNHHVRLAARELLQRWAIGGRATAAVAGDSPLETLLAKLNELGGDDLIVAPGRRPAMKCMGSISPIGDEVLTVEQVQGLLVDLLTPTQRDMLADGRDVDLSYDAKLTKARFRANVFFQMTGVAAVFRSIKNTISDLDSLGLPPVVCKLAELKHGLVLVGGATGAGKSTTLAALINYINETRTRHIVTIEDPIEIVHERKMSLINQREVGTHTSSFDHALRATLRKDPDVILIGEMRDLETMSFAVTAAETGHLVFATVHTVSAPKSVDRIINAFPSKQQSQVRAMLADTLQAVVCQHLIRRKDGAGRVLAVEVMTGNEAVAAMVRKGKTYQLPSVIATHGEVGMQSMDSQLLDLVQRDIITPEEGFMRAADKGAFEAYLREHDTAEAKRTQLEGRAPKDGAAEGSAESPPSERSGPISISTDIEPDPGALIAPEGVASPKSSQTITWDPADSSMFASTASAAAPSRPQPSRPQPSDHQASQAPPRSRDPRREQISEEPSQPAGTMPAAESSAPLASEAPPSSTRIGGVDDAPASRRRRDGRAPVREAPSQRGRRDPRSPVREARTERFDPRAPRRDPRAPQSRSSAPASEAGEARRRDPRRRSRKPEDES